jgi:hypothetical protein
MATMSMHHFSTYRSFAIAAFAFILFAFAGCKSNNVMINQGGIPMVGALSGRIQLYDGTGKALSSDSGVSVVAMNSYDSVITNDSGQWLMRIGQGGYTLTFTKSGFGTVMQFGDTVTANDTARDSEVVMSEAPTDGVGFAPFQFIAPNTLIFNGKMPGQSSSQWIAERTIVCCVSPDSASLAANPYEAPWIFAFTLAGNGYDGSFMVDTTIREASIANDTMLYACICIAGEGTNYQSFSHYYDPQTMQEVYSALGPRSQILSAKVP